MIKFLAGYYIGGACVELATSLFIGMTVKQSLVAGAIWPYTSVKVVIQRYKASRRNR